MSFNAAAIQAILHAKPEIVKLKVEKDDENDDKPQLVIQCQDCSLSFLTLSSLALHTLNIHFDKFEKLDNEDSGKFSCEICDKTFETKTGKYQHQTRVHGGSNKTIKTEPDRSLHEVVTCSICNKNITRYNLRAHMRTHGKKSDECTVCGKFYSSSRSLSRHIAEVHEKSGMQKCPFCDKIYSEPTGLKRHMATHESGGLIPCQVCGKLVNKLRMNTHVQTHEVGDFCCAICGKTYINKRSLVRHIRQIHEKNQMGSCHFCGKVCFDRSALKRHIQRHLGIPGSLKDSKNMRRNDENNDKNEDISKDRPRPKVSCEICGIVVLKRYLSLHLTLHGPKQYSCEKCGNSYTFKASLKKHLLVHSEDRQKMTCKICSKTLIDTRAMKYHMRGHTAEGRMACQICGTVVLVHVMSQHLLTHGEKKYQCTVCGKAFSQRAGLIQHSYTSHRPTKPPKESKRPCDLCHKYFANSTSLRFHKNSVHGLGPVCEFCSKIFGSRDKLLLHLQVHKVQFIQQQTV